MNKNFRQTVVHAISERACGELPLAMDEGVRVRRGMVVAAGEERP